MRVAVGSDHHGVELRATLKAQLEADGHQVMDVGAYGSESVDYPDIAADVARQVGEGSADRGLLICASGIGMSIAANKVTAVRAAVCRDEKAAEMSRRHNDANVLCLSDGVPVAQNQAVVEMWMRTDFDGGRHQRRVDKISALESQCD
jgi:ribose 5-phosphate isomerase B